MVEAWVASATSPPSFCQDKIEHRWRRRLMVTNDEDMWKRAWSAREHGKSRDTVHRDDQPPGFRWVVESLGSNWRMTGPQAAIGLRRLDKFDIGVAEGSTTPIY